MLTALGPPIIETISTQWNELAETADSVATFAKAMG